MRKFIGVILMSIGCYVIETVLEIIVTMIKCKKDCRNCKELCCFRGEYGV